MYLYYAGPDYKCLSDMVTLEIYIFCRTVLGNFMSVKL